MMTAGVRAAFVASQHAARMMVPVRRGLIVNISSWHRAIDTSLPPGTDFTEPGHEIKIDPADHYIANPRSTVVLFAQ